EGRHSSAGRLAGLRSDEPAGLPTARTAHDRAAPADLQEEDTVAEDDAGPRDDLLPPVPCEAARHELHHEVRVVFEPLELRDHVVEALRVEPAAAEELRPASTHDERPAAAGLPRDLHGH